MLSGSSEDRRGAASGPAAERPHLGRGSMPGQCSGQMTWAPPSSWPRFPLLPGPEIVTGDTLCSSIGAFICLGAFASRVIKAPSPAS